MLKLRDGEKFVAEKKHAFHFCDKQLQTGFLASVAHRWLQQIRLFPLQR